MAKKGAETREKILNTAEAIVLDRGFSGMSIDMLIEALGLTKGAFFHHFRNKGDLATSLISRYSASDLKFFRDSLARSEKLSKDPLQQLLIVIGLYEEEFDNLSDPHPGCLMAAYIYEMQLFEDQIMDTINDVFLQWRKELVARFEQIAKVYPPRINVDFPSLADEFTVIIEGAFIMAKSLKDPDIVVKQLQHYKQYLELVFQPVGKGGE